MQPNEQRCFQEKLKEWEEALQSASKRCPQSLLLPKQQRIDRLDEPAGPSSRTSRSGRSWSRCVDEPGEERARYLGGIKKRDDSRGKERLQSLPHHNPTNDSVCL
jgi:hypothetical protein